MRPVAIECLLGACLALQAANLNSNAAAPSPAAPSAARLTEAYGKLPLYFEPNLGQAPGGVRYLTRVPGATILLRDTEAVIQLRRTEAEGQENRAVLRMRLAGAATPRRVEPLDKLPGISNYFIGRDPKRWRTDIPQFQRVRYEQVYPGVDLVYYGNGAQLQYDFTVEPGVDAGAIQLQFEGMKGLRIEESGDLLLETALGDLRLAKPVVYQESEGGRRLVEAGYRLLAEGRVGFAVGEYDRSRRLVIDPTLVYSTYLGGATSSTYGYGMAVDAGANAYIVGYTSANDFPTVDPIQGTLSYNSDVFVSKLNSTGTALLWSTYLGGSSSDSGYDIALDASQNVYITGNTGSSDFPVLNAVQTTYGGSQDAFVAKLSSSGNSLVYSTFLGGSNYDYGRGIAVNPSSGDAYVTGYTFSTDFPVQAAYQAALSVGPDAFVAKFNAAGVRQFSTYLGGSNFDLGSRIALDGVGNAFVTGYTDSDNFPTTAGVLQTSRKGAYDAFVTKMASDGSGLVYSTYLGGSDLDQAMGIAVHSSGSAYIAGHTYSSDFPTTAGVVQPSLQGIADGFVAMLNADGTALSFGTFLGGGKLEYSYDLAVDEPAGNVYVTGYTYSGDFPMANALQPVKPNPSTVLYRTGDGGSNWGPADSGLSAATVYALSIDPGTPATVVAGTNYGVYRSTDSGSNWSRPWASSASVLARSPSSPSTLYAVSRGEIYQSTDGGVSWVYRGFIPGPSIQALAVHPTISGTLYGWTNSGGVYRSLDSGASWTQVSNGLGNLNVRSLAIDPTNANVLYAGTVGSSVYKTTDGAVTWNVASTGMSGGSVLALAMDPSNSSVLYAARSSCIHKTTDAAANWNSMGCLGSTIYGLAVAPSDPAVLYAGTSSNGVWRSADAGVTWNPANSGIDDRYIYSLAVHPTDASVVYTGTSVTYDAFVTKLNAAGTAYVYSTYLGAPQANNEVLGIAADAGGNAYVTGYTSSYSFPTTAGALKRSSQIIPQAFVAKISDATASCAYDLNSANQFFYPGGGTAKFSVVSPSGCAWTATPGAGWIGVTAGSSGTGVGAVSISVGANSGAARSANLDVGGQTIVITQAASGCSYALNPTSFYAILSGGSRDITLTVGAGCDWVVQNPYSWITVTPPSSGTGSATLTLSVAANPDLHGRSGTVLIGGRSFLVTQEGAGPDLRLTKTHGGAFTVGGTGVYTLAVINSTTGMMASSGTITVTDTLPAGLSYVSGTGTGWSCSALGQVVTCTNPGPVEARSGTDIALTVAVGAAAYPAVTNTASLSNSSDVNASNNSASDPTTVTGTPFSCVAQSIPMLVRAESLADLVGDVKLICSGLAPAGGILANVRVTLNTNITSRVIIATPAITDALLLIDEPGPDTLDSGTNWGSAFVISNNAIEFQGVQLAAAGANALKTFRITNIRANAAAVGVGGTIYAAVNVTAVTSVPVDNGVVVVADTRSGLSFQMRGCNDSSAAAGSYPQCTGLNSGLYTGTSANGSMQFAVRFTEGFGSVFKPRVEPGQDPSSPGAAYKSESGYVNTTVLGGRGFATQGTRLIARFQNVPTGVRIFVSTAPLSTSSSHLSAVLVATDSTGAGEFSPVSSTGTGTCPQSGDSKPIAEVSLSGGSGVAVWEITEIDGASFVLSESVSFGVVVAYSGGSPELGTATVSGALAPLSTLGTMSAAAPVPRFVDTATPVSAFSTVGCVLEKVGAYNAGAWKLDANSNGVFDAGVDKSFDWGWADTTPVYGDWNGDGKDEAGFFKDGLWYLDYNGNGVWDGDATDKMYSFGMAGVELKVGDWNGDGIDEIGIYIDGFWFLDMNGNGAWDGEPTDKMIIWGFVGSTPVTGDWNGDGKTKVGLYKDGLWYLDVDGNGIWDGGTTDKMIAWGWPGTTPVHGDWNGDGKEEVGVYLNGFWYLDMDGNGIWDGGTTDKMIILGWSGTLPVVGDWSGDGTTKVGTYINGYWYLDHNGNGAWDGESTDKAYVFGQAGDTPIVGGW